MSNIKKIAKGTAIYSATSVLQRGINFFLLPLFAIYFSTSDFGILGTVQALTGFIDILLLMGLNSAATRFYYQYKKESPDKIGTLWATLYGMSLTSGVLVLLFCLTIGKPLVLWLLHEIPFYPYFVYGILGSILVATFSIFTASLQAQEKYAQFGIFNMVFVGLQAALTLWFIWNFGMRAEAPLLSRVITFALFFVFLLYFTRHEIHWRFDPRVARDIFFYTLPLCIHLLGGWTQTALDRVILNRTTNLDTVGVFQVAVQIAFPLTALTGAMISAISPWMTRNILQNSDHYKKRLVAISPLFFALIGLAFLYYLEVSRWIIAHYFGSKYLAALPILGFLTFGHFVQMYYVIFIQPLFVIPNGTTKIPRVSIPAALVQTVLLFILAPRFQSIGCAVSFAASMSTLSILAFFYSQRHFSIRWKGVIFMPAAAFFSYLTLQWYFPDQKIWWFSGCTIILLVLAAPSARKSHGALKEIFS